MIIDSETNTLYLSRLLQKKEKYRSFYTDFISTLNSFNIHPEFLDKTKDIWARDFMPIQISMNEFVEYRYDPDYLQANKWRKKKTYPDIVCDGKFPTIKSEIILDGGNVIKSKNTIILTDKVILENKDTYNEKELIAKLKETFKVEKVILIPKDKDDDFGHADGMIRFLNENTVFVNDYSKTKKRQEWEEKFFNSITDLKQIPVPYFEVDEINKQPISTATGCYINYLQVGKAVIIPKFKGLENENKEALVLFKQYFGNDNVKQVDCTLLAKEGGVLNCISWNILV